VKHFELYFMDGPDHGTIRMSDKRMPNFTVLRVNPTMPVVQPERGVPELALAEKGTYELVGGFTNPVTGRVKAFYLWRGWSSERSQW